MAKARAPSSDVKVEGGGLLEGSGIPGVFSEEVPDKDEGEGACVLPTESGSVPLSCLLCVSNQ